MGKWTDKPWERQKGESEKAFEAFAAYRDMGPERSLRAVGQQLGKSKALMERWSVAHDWQERVRAYENELDKEARAKAVKGRKDMTERHIKIAMQVQKRHWKPSPACQSRICPQRTLRSISKWRPTSSG